MIETSIWKEIEAFASEGTFLYEEPLRNHTTFRVGGKADAFLSVNNEEELKKTVQLCKEKNVPYFILFNRWFFSHFLSSVA